MEYADITNIQRFSVQDGPGIRTTVFFQGCNLHCRWCHNPETIPFEPTPLYYKNRCIGCADCISACPEKALRWDGGPVRRAGSCKECGACFSACPSRAWTKSSQKMELAEVLERIERDKSFYDSSGGGVTCSGGEPMLSLRFLKQLLAQCHQRNIFTAVDTAGNVPWEWYESIQEDTDLFLVDFKLFSQEAHRYQTGVPPGQIQDNLRRFAGGKAGVRVRIPVIPGVNDNREEAGRMAEFLREIGFHGLVELLPFHLLGKGKYDSMRRPYPFSETVPPSKEQMSALTKLFRAAGLSAAAAL